MISTEQLIHKFRSNLAELEQIFAFLKGSQSKGSEEKMQDAPSGTSPGSSRENPFVVEDMYDCTMGLDTNL